MPSRIEDYALIGDCETAALVARNGSIDWMCLPRFDSPACFAALLGTPEHGRWLISPVSGVKRIRRRYRDDTLILETIFELEHGEVALIDFMPFRKTHTEVVRIVECRKGEAAMHMDLAIRFDYGSIVPWVRRVDGGISAIAGPDSLLLRTDVDVRGKGFHSVAEFKLSQGESTSFRLTWYPSHHSPPDAADPPRDLEETESWWRRWSARCTYRGEWREAVVRSLITLKALTYSPTGGVVAAPTTSLPERIGGIRNWDYRFCWLRDAAFTLYALLVGGYAEEAAAWREWLLRAAAGKPSDLQVLYGLAGERRNPEYELPWLPGYEQSAPVRIGNAAAEQLQLDVYGEVLDAFHFAQVSGLTLSKDAWALGRALLDFLETAWARPSQGIWEVRGPERHFVHSKVMAWVAFDRGVKAIERFGHDGPLQKWRGLRRKIHEEICRRGFDAELGSFVQSFGSKELDASLLMIPLVGFLPARDVRMRGTVSAIWRKLRRDGLVERYRTQADVDGLPPGEGLFLLCSFWLSDNLALQKRRCLARSVFERLLSLRNDVGLLAEQYDPVAQRLVGNFPQALSHVGLINTARNLSLAAKQQPSRTLTLEQDLHRVLPQADSAH
jgi:GH15 family glucan-1,4-alpha-glucosidase